MSRATYAETRCKLVMAFDVGTQFSSISYSIINPGQAPFVNGVRRFPAQKHVTWSSKTPTIIYYDPQGATRAIGYGAVKSRVLEKAADGDWIKSECFKLHLQPKSPSRGQIIPNIPPLPNGKTVVQVFADYYRYLFECTCTYIKDIHLAGDTLLATLGPRIDFVLSHPNGWEGPQQYQMREAAVLAGLIPDTPEGHSRIWFVSEGEANLRSAINNGFQSMDDEGVLIVDAGDRTINISAYARQSQSYIEIVAPQCHLGGSAFVTEEARKFLSNFLLGSDFIGDLEKIVECFDVTTKPRFGDVEETQYITFGSYRDNEAEFNIRHGRLKLSWHEVASFFDLSIASVVDSVKELRDSAWRKLHHVVLVGRFASSDYLYSRLQALQEPDGFRVTRPETVNTVADGAISFYLDHLVQSRIAEVTYGSIGPDTPRRYDTQTLCSGKAISLYFDHLVQPRIAEATYGSIGDIPYDPNDPEHLERQNNTYMALSGERHINGFFTVILPKDAKISEMKEFRKPFTTQAELMTDFLLLTVTLWSYKGSLSQPKWNDVDKEMYSEVCTIELDLYDLARKTRECKKVGPGGRYYLLQYDLALHFGLTELKAQVVYMDEGIEKRSDATIIYCSD